MTALPPCAVIFDLDGTLLDSAPDIHATANLVLAQHGLPLVTPAQTRSFIGNGVPHLVRCLIEASGVDMALHPVMVRDFLDHYDSAVNLSALYPGVTDALEALRSAGHPMAICTNKPEAPARAVLAHFGIDGYFRAIIGGDTLPERKPDPAPLHHAHAALGGGPMIYVGDSEVDAETARRAGATFALFTEGYRKTGIEAIPHAVAFCNFHELPAIATQGPNGRA